MFVFITLAGVGLLFLVFSAIHGDHDHDFGGHETSFEHGYESDGSGHDHPSGPSPFSLRVIAIFICAFGAGGAIARVYMLSYVKSSAVGLVTGLCLGFLAWKLIGMLYKQQASSIVTDSDMQAASASVRIAIPKDGVGEISIETRKQRKTMSARTSDGHPIADGATVDIKEIVGGVAIVQERQ